MAEPASILGRRVLRLVEAPTAAPRRHGLALALVCASVPALAWIAPGASWAHDEPAMVDADALQLAQLVELDALAAMPTDVFPLVIEGGPARVEHDALQHGEAPRAAAARSVDEAKRTRRSARKAERAAAKDRAAARRDAQRDIKRAFRSAQRHDTLPDPERVAAIVARARAEADVESSQPHVVVHAEPRIVVERDGDRVIVRKDGKVILRSGGRDRARGKPHGGNRKDSVDVKVLDHEGNVVHIEIPQVDVDGIREHQREAIERALREVHRAREHVEAARARIHGERDRIRQELHRRHVVPPGHAPRAPRPPGFRGDIVPISPMPSPPPMPSMPPEAALAPMPPMPPMAPSAPMPRPELVPLAPAPPAARPHAPRAPKAPRAPQAPRAPKAPKAPKAAPGGTPGIAPVALPTSA